MSLHERLRRHTGAAHAALERALAAERCFDSRSGYVRFLERFHLFQSETEEALSSGGAERVIPDWRSRTRAALLAEDLRALGVHPGASVTAAVGARILSAEEVLGTVYVLEGATLGGAVLLRRLAPLGITSRAGGHFLASYGSDRGRMWQQFLRALRAWEARGVDAQRVLDAALATFHAAGRSLLTTSPHASARPGVAPRLATEPRTARHRAPT